MIDSKKGSSHFVHPKLINIEDNNTFMTSLKDTKPDKVQELMSFYRLSENKRMSLSKDRVDSKCSTEESSSK